MINTIILIKVGGEIMIWNFDNDRPIYTQIIEHMKFFIISGELKPGSKLASVRDLASEAGVNPNTMQRALAELERTELVYSNRTSGRFITENEDIIKMTKTEVAEKNIQLFLDNMKKIGYDKNETLSLLENYKKGDENNE